MMEVRRGKGEKRQSFLPYWVVLQRTNYGPLNDWCKSSTLSTTSALQRGKRLIKGIADQHHLPGKKGESDQIGLGKAEVPLGQDPEEQVW